MIWRILGLIGAGSFFVNGFDLLSDPSCVSADFGGGRVIQVTCRSDSYGTFSGTQAGLISLFIGVGLLTFIFFNQIKQFFNKPALPPEWKNVSINNSEGLVDIKVCDYCEDSVPLDLQKCPQCEGTYFNYKKVAALATVKPAKKVEVDAPDNQTKKCPMCAEEIKLEAMKCRFCQHSFIESGVQKFNTSTTTFFKKSFSKQFLPLTIILVIIIVVGLGFGLNARSNSIERNQLLALGEVCVESADGEVDYGCADYPNYKFSYCSEYPYGDANFSEPYAPFGERHKLGSLSVTCPSSNPYAHSHSGTIDKLKSESAITIWGYTKAEFNADDFNVDGRLVMKINLKE
jgi:hypothetical protein